MLDGGDVGTLGGAHAPWQPPSEFANNRPYARLLELGSRTLGLAAEPAKPNL
jgi:hypothetical protein